MVVPDAFKARLHQLTSRDPILKDAFQKKIKAVLEYPTTIGKRSVHPSDTRHIHVKDHWVLFWSVKGKEVTLLDRGHHDEFFK